jgi:hypothetical protein
MVNFSSICKKTDMKRITLLILIACNLQIGYRQVVDHALGIRAGLGGGVSYQHKLSKVNRLEVNGGVNIGNSVTYLRVSGAYQWVYDIGIGLNVYVGPSATTGLQFLAGDVDGSKDGLFILLGGQAGFDYYFQSVPFQISLDVMPQFGVFNSKEDIYFDPALGIRYVF